MIAIARICSSAERQQGPEVGVSCEMTIRSSATACRRWEPLGELTGWTELERCTKGVANSAAEQGPDRPLRIYRRLRLHGQPVVPTGCINATDSCHGREIGAGSAHNAPEPAQWARKLNWERRNRAQGIRRGQAARWAQAG
jgi:hypothetical protein